MRTINQRIVWRRLALLAAGATFLLGGCDPQIRATVEDGIISMSQSVLSSFLQAFIQVLQETTA